MTTWFCNVRETTWPALVLAIGAVFGASLLVNFVGSQPPVTEAIGAVERATGGLVQGVLIAGPVYFAIVGTVIFGVGRLRPSDVGWRLSALGPGLLVTLGFWVAMQPGLALWTVGSGDALRWNDAWSESSEWGAGRLVGQLLGQLLGNALLEEMVFRGFFLPQFFLKASVRFRPGVALVLAILGSQTLFALVHIPNRLFVQSRPVEELLGDQLALVWHGIGYCVVYLVTRNLFVCVGLHSLWNQPARLLPVPFSPGVQVVWYALALILLVAWALARRFNARRRSLATEYKATQAPAEQAAAADGGREAGF
jgi:membrane protease YdiL (CAAX protease family)